MIYHRTNGYTWHERLFLIHNIIKKMYILAWADNLYWVQLFIVWTYNTIEEADDEMLRCIKQDIRYEFDDDIDDNHVEDLIHSMINGHYKDSDRVDYVTWQYVDYTRPDWDIIKYLIHTIYDEQI